MKKFLLIFLIILKPNFSFSEIVPCNEPKCDKKFDLTLTRFIEAKEKNDFRKKIIYFSLIISAFLLTGIITLI